MRAQTIEYFACTCKPARGICPSAPPYDDALRQSSTTYPAAAVVSIYSFAVPGTGRTASTAAPGWRRSTATWHCRRLLRGGYRGHKGETGHATVLRACWLEAWRCGSLRQQRPKPCVDITLRVSSVRVGDTHGVASCLHRQQQSHAVPFCWRNLLTRQAQQSTSAVRCLPYTIQPSSVPVLAFTKWLQHAERGRQPSAHLRLLLLRLQAVVRAPSRLAAAPSRST